jgi:hypothetical protein
MFRLNKADVIILSWILIIAIISVFMGVIRYSPDSWSYYELSQKFKLGEIYKFNTYRSYRYDEHSTSFPFLMPLLIKIIGAIFEHTPNLQKYINVVIMMTTVCIFKIIDIKLKLRDQFFVVASILILGNIYYIDEVFAGGSIPLSALLLTLSFYFHLVKRIFFTGFMLGLGVLNRFDFLLTSICILFLLYYKNDSSASLKNILLKLFGYVIAVSPWIFYSFIHFGVLWASDNSWVALSAEKRFVLDYPPYAKETIFTNPMDWFYKILINTNPLIISLLQYTLSVPILFYIISMIQFKNISLRPKSLILSSFFTFILIFPTIATGYFDHRYYIIPSMIFLGSLALFEKIKNGSKIILIISAIFMFLYSIINLPATYIYKYYIYNNKDLPLIKSVESCQKRIPNSIFLFGVDFEVFSAFKYGAITGLPVAIYPSNKLTMSPQDEKNFLSFLSTKGNVIYINNYDDVIKKCGAIF